MSSAPPAQTSRRCRIGEWDFDPVDGTLRRPPVDLRLEPKVAQILTCLLQRAGEVISHEEIIDEVWPDTHVDPVALPRCVSQLRKALGDTARPHRYVETLPKRGYRLIADVRLDPVAVAPTSASRRRWRLYGVVGGLVAASVLMVALVAGIVTWPSGESSLELYERGAALYARYQRDTTDEAITLFRRAVAIDPDFAPAHAGLANAYTRRFASYGFGTDQLDAAWASSERALELDPELAEGHRARGYVLAIMGRHRESLAAYRRALALQPDHPDVLHNVGVALWRHGDWYGGLRYVQRRVALGDANAHALNNLATMLFALGFEAQAEAAWARSLALEPERDLTHTAIAEARLLAGNFADARSRLDERLQRSPHCLGCWRARARLAHVDAANDDPRDWAQRAYDKFPDNVSIALELAAVLRDRDPLRAQALLESAERSLRQALDAGSEAPRQPLGMARVAALRGDADAAIDWYQQAYAAGHRRYFDDAIEPAFATLRADPRFVTIMQQMRVSVETMREQARRDGLDAPPMVAAGTVSQ